MTNIRYVLALRLNVDGVFLFFAEGRASFPLVSTEKEKLVPTVKEKEKGIDLPASILENSRHWDTSDSSECIADIFTAYF